MQKQLDSLEEQFFSYVEQNHLLQSSDRVLAGISGGADSVCLLFLLCRLRDRMPFFLKVVHVNHGIREEATEDASYVESCCREWGVDYELVTASVPKQALIWKCSEEEAGRRIRYEAFARIAEKEKCSKIAVAHHLQDNAETILFHLFRGTGLQGLLGMQNRRVCNVCATGQDYEIIRPLLFADRGEIEAYLHKQGISWQTDQTNASVNYARNRIRHCILPQAEQISSGSALHINETARQLAQVQDLLQGLVQSAMEQLVVWDNELGDKAEPTGQAGKQEVLVKTEEAEELIGTRKSEELISTEDSEILERSKGICQINALAWQQANLHIAVKNALLLQVLERMTPYRRDISAVHVAQLLDLLERTGNRTCHFPYGIRGSRSYEKVTLLVEPVKQQPVGLIWDEIKWDDPKQDASKQDELMQDSSKQLGEEITLPAYTTEILDISAFSEQEREMLVRENQYTKCFDYDKIGGSVILRTRKAGDFLTIGNQKNVYGKQTLKQFMINEKIPAEERARIPIFAVDDHCIWVVGYRMSESVKITSQTRLVLKIQIENGEK